MRSFERDYRYIGPFYVSATNSVADFTGSELQAWLLRFAINKTSAEHDPTKFCPRIVGRQWFRAIRTRHQPPRLPFWNDNRAATFGTLEGFWKG